LRRRRIVLLAGFTALALTVAGCGGGGDNGSTGNTQAGGETTFADLSGQTVEVSAVWTGAEQEAFKAVLDDFASKTRPPSTTPRRVTTRPPSTVARSPVARPRTSA